jgi:CRP/FNR family transcriptional regulator
LTLRKSAAFFGNWFKVVIGDIIISMEFLATIPLFASMKRADLDRAGRQAIRRSYRKDEPVTWHGEVWPYLLLVEEGTIKAVKESREGRSLILTTLEPGDVFWGLAFFNDDTPMPVTLTAQDDVRLYLWSRERLLPLLLENSRVLWELSRLMIARMEKASLVVEDLAFQPIAGRLARLLLDHYGGSSDGPVSRDLSLDEMAAYIGSTSEMVCRALYSFSDEKLIHITRTEFALNDKDGLAQLARR